jgi:molybdenum cofactor guanylyltransferase
MGCDKALLPFRGGTLGGAVARAVEGAAGSAVLVGNPALAGILGFPAIPDLFPGEGPLGGILTALAHGNAGWSLVVACDMPELSAGFLRGLIESAERSDADVLLATGPSDLPEPLCAAYRGRARPAIEAAFGRGVRKITAALDGLRTAAWIVPQLAPFQNVNTPEDWAGYASE